MSSTLTGQNVLAANSTLIAQRGSVVDLSQAQIRINAELFRGPKGDPGPEASVVYAFKNVNCAIPVGAYYVVDTTTNVVTVTLPATPNPGDVVTIVDAKGTWGTNNLIIDRNGKPLQGVQSNLTVDQAGSLVILIYIDDNYGWS